MLYLKTRGCHALVGDELKARDGSHPVRSRARDLQGDRLVPIIGAGRTSLTEATAGDAKKMLQVALVNEISVSEVAAAWMPTTPEIDVKLALARQAGDEAGHFHARW